MKKLIGFILISLVFIACKSEKDFSKPENVVKQYFEGLKKGKFDTSLWNLKRFVIIYYKKYWDKAEKIDQDKLIELVGEFANNMAKLQKRMPESSKITSLKITRDGKTDKTIEVLFTHKKIKEIAMTITFALEKQGDVWKIYNYEKISYKDNNIDLLKSFKENLPKILKDSGYFYENLDLKIINKFIEEKLLNRK